MNIDVKQLRDELTSKRWFGEKDRAIKSVDIHDQGVLSDGDEALVLCIIRVSFVDGGESLYHLPLLVSGKTQRDASEKPERLRVLGELLAHGQPIKGDHGVFHFSGPGLDPGNPPGSGSVRTIDSEQSNTSIVFDDTIIFKFFRKIEPGPNPDLELSRLLTNEGFRHIPEQLGEVFYEPTQDAEVVPEETRTPDIDLGMAQRFVEGAREGWGIALDHLGRLFDEIHDADVAEDMRTLVEDRSQDLLSAIEQLGEVTASLHVTLSREDFEDELRPEPVTPEDLNHWASTALRSLDNLSGRSDELKALAPRVSAQIGRIKELTEAGWRTRIHGDYHLGQVLRVPRVWYVLDFEGEPARALEERRSKHSPLKDVAGMLRSLSYAAYAALFERTEPGAEVWGDLEPWALTWEDLARERFLTTYLAKSHEGRFLPGDHDELQTLLDFFELDKAIYEVGYEMGSRPEWVRIPLKGISRTLERSELR